MVSDVKRILAVVNNRDDAEAVISKARIIASHHSASIHVVKVVYEGFVDLSVHEVSQSQELKSSLMQVAQARVSEWLDALQAGDVSASCIWHKHEYQAIIDAAVEFEADLIIKPTNYPEHNVIRTPQDWNLLRHTHLPVLLVKPIAWRQQPVIVAALDVENESQADLNTRIVREAGLVTRGLSGSLHLTCAFPSVEEWIGPITIAIDFDKVRDQVSKKITSQLSGMARLQDVEIAGVHSIEGETAEALTTLVSRLDAEILIIGTEQRTAPQSLVIGNTSEDILHSVSADVLVLR